MDGIGNIGDIFVIESSHADATIGKHIDMMLLDHSVTLVSYNKMD
jgi:hypothetical protein